MIHKLVTSTKLCEDFAYQLCSPIQVNSNKLLYKELRKLCKHRLKDVTCSLCLELKNIRKQTKTWDPSWFNFGAVSQLVKDTDCKSVATG